MNDSSHCFTWFKQHFGTYNVSYLHLRNLSGGNEALISMILGGYKAERKKKREIEGQRENEEEREEGKGRETKSYLFRRMQGG